MNKFLSCCAAFYCLLSPYAVDAKALTVEDLPTPYNLQSVVKNQSVTLSWTWEPPNPGPTFQSFGYEVFRGTGGVAVVGKTAWTDFGLPIGTHTYKVRIKGVSKEMGKRVTHLSGWSEPVSAKIVQTCGGPPMINLTVEPTRRKYGAVHSLRLHFKGDVTVPAGCTLQGAKFHIDSGRSTQRVGPLTLDSKGRFDQFVDAMGPEDEYITGQVTFNITATAENEAGGSTSNVFSIDLERENPYAPKQELF